VQAMEQPQGRHSGARHSGSTQWRSLQDTIHRARSGSLPQDTVDHRDGEFHDTFSPQYHWNFAPNWVNSTIKKRISHQKGPQNFHSQYDAFRPLFAPTFTFFCSEFCRVPGLKLSKRISLSSFLPLIAALICVVQVKPPSTKIISPFI
jgi:hypothetical protein